MTDKPFLDVSNVDGNIFVVMGAARNVLKKAGLGDKVGEMVERVMASDDYYKALRIISDYVDMGV